MQAFHILKQDYNKSLSRIGNLRKEISLTVHDEETRLFLIKTKEMEDVLNTLDVSKVGHKELNILVRSLENCLKILKSIKDPNVLNEEENKNALKQLNSDLPALMKSQNPNIRNSAWSIGECIIAGLVVLGMAFVIIAAIVLACTGNGGDMGGFIPTMGGGLGNPATPQPLSESKAITRQMGESLEQFKNAVPEYKKRSAEGRSINASNNIEVSEVTPNTNKRGI